MPFPALEHGLESVRGTLIERPRLRHVHFGERTHGGWHLSVQLLDLMINPAFG
jgi:hypothetical protein